MCFNSRLQNTEDSHKVFESYNINLNEYKQLANEIFYEYTKSDDNSNTLK